jgi:hypothetical protein
MVLSGTAIVVERFGIQKTMLIVRGENNGQAISGKWWSAPELPASP